MKIKIQYSIIALAIASLIYGVIKFQETGALILPMWLITVLVFIVVLGVSSALGFLAKTFLGSNWHAVSFTSFFIILIVGIYAIIDYKPTLRLIIPENYAGEVKLFVSNQHKSNHEIVVNKYGIGYIDFSNFDEGFYPKIIHGNFDITNTVKEYYKGQFATTTNDKYSYKFLSFAIPGKGSIQDYTLEDFLKSGAIDTTKLLEK